MNRFVPLREIANVGLGFKSLQNEFFYVSEATIQEFQIESEYLARISTLRDLDGQKYLQVPPDRNWLFSCSSKQSDLSGTGALKYINAMAGRPAVKKKQSGKPTTIRKALSAQGGKLWYAPKAQPHKSHLWLRKAMSTVYAPFVFESAKVIDQRCNYLEPIDIEWPVLGAVITSTVFVYALEVNGSASMGAGALETPTSKIKDYPVFDPRTLDSAKQKEIAQLVEKVWASERPLDWAKQKKPGPMLQKLDEKILEFSGSTLSVKQLYADVIETCRARIFVAGDKVRTKKKQKTDSIGVVAETIATPLARLIASRKFPEHFVPAATEMFSVSIPQEKMAKITTQPFFDETSIIIEASDGKELMHGKFAAAVAELIVRALLMGREHFEVPLDRTVAEATGAEFEQWFSKIRDRINKGVEESSVGTGYSSTLSAEVYNRLGIHPALAESSIPLEIYK